MKNRSSCATELHHEDDSEWTGPLQEIYPHCLHHELDVVTSGLIPQGWRMPSWRELPSIHRDDMPCELERSAIVRLLDIAILWGDAKTAAWCSRRCELRPFSFAPKWKPKNIDVPGPRKVEPEKTKEDGERDAMPGMLCCMTWMG